MWKCGKESLQEKDEDGALTGKLLSYDHVFDPSVSTSDVYNVMAKHIIEGSMDGYNGCVPPHRP